MPKKDEQLHKNHERFERLFWGFFGISLILLPLLVFIEINIPKVNRGVNTIKDTLVDSIVKTDKEILQEENTKSEKRENYFDRIIPNTNLTIKKSLVEYAEPEIIKEYKGKDPKGNDIEVNFYKVGRINGEDYFNYDIIRSDYFLNQKSCPGICDVESYHLFLKYDTALILLNQGEERYVYDLYKDISEKLGWIVGKTDLINIEGLTIQENFLYETTKFEFVKRYKGDADNKVYKIFEDEWFGNVYTSDPAYTPNEPFYNEGENPYILEETEIAGGIKSCKNEECFVTNAFFVFLPDGTFLAYKMVPEIYDDVGLLGKNRFTFGNYGGQYMGLTKSGCSDNDATYLTVSGPKDGATEEDLEQITSTMKFREPIYALSDPNHPLLQSLYTKYRDSYPDWPAVELSENGSYIYGNFNKLPSESYEEFLDSYPYLFWKDPFGRILRFINYKYIPPKSCN